MFLNPLLAFKESEKKKQSTNKDEDEEASEWSDDDKYEPKMTKEDKR